MKRIKKATLKYHILSVSVSCVLVSYGCCNETDRLGGLKQIYSLPVPGVRRVHHYQWTEIKARAGAHTPQRLKWGESGSISGLWLPPFSQGQHLQISLYSTFTWYSLLDTCPVSFCLLLIRIHVIVFNAHSDNPGQSLYLKISIIITTAKASFFPK